MWSYKFYELGLDKGKRPVKAASEGKIYKYTTKRQHIHSSWGIRTPITRASTKNTYSSRTSTATQTSSTNRKVPRSKYYAQITTRKRSQKAGLYDKT